MAVFSGRRGRGGSGSGFRLGPTQNNFGSSTSTLTQAEAARDAYATANPSWLATYDGNSGLGIYLVYVDSNSNVNIQPQSRSNNAWVNNAGFIAVQGRDGADGTALEFASIAERDSFFSLRPDLLRTNLPTMVSTNSTTVTTQIWTGSTSPATYVPATDAVFFRAATIRADTSSFELGDVHKITSGGENVYFENQDSDNNYFPPWQAVGDHRTPAGRTVQNRPTARTYGALQFVEFGGAVATSGAIDYEVDFTLPANESVYGVKVVPAETFSGNITYSVTRVRQGGNLVVYNHEEVISAVAGMELELWFEVPLDGRQGTETQIRLSKQDGSLLSVRPTASDSTNPYTEVRLRNFTDDPLAYQSELTNPSGRAIELTGDISITSSNVSTYEGSFVYIPDSDTTVGTTYNVTIAPDSGLKAIDFYIFGAPSIRVATSGSGRIQRELDITIKRLEGGRLVADPSDATKWAFVYESSSPTFDDQYVTGLTSNRAGNMVTLTATRSAGLPDLTTTFMVAGGGGNPADISATITRFEIAGQSTSVVAGTTLSGTQTFNYNVQHPEDVSGNLSLVQNGVVLRSDISPTGSSFTQAITSQTLQDNQEVVFELRGLTNENISISRFFRVRAHAPAETLYYGLSNTNTPASVSVATFNTVEAGIDNSNVSTGTTTQGQYFMILTPNDHDIISIRDTVLDQDVTSIFTRTANVRAINTVQYNSYVVGPLSAGVDENYVLSF